MSVELFFKDMQASQITTIQKCLTLIPIDKEAEKRRLWKNAPKIHVKEAIPVLMFIQNASNTGVFVPFKFASMLTGKLCNQSPYHTKIINTDTSGIKSPGFAAVLREPQVPIVLEALEHLKQYGTTTLGLPPATGKCLHPETEILKFNGEVIKVKNVEVGDELMGDDSTKRTVLSTCSGSDDMYEINYSGKSFVCNSPHVLTLKKEGKIFDMPLNEYLALKDKEGIYLFSTAVDFPESKVEVDPYAVGYILKNLPGKLRIENQKVLEYLQSTLKIKKGMFYYEVDKFYYSIPQEYKINSRKIRLATLAGILDNCQICEGKYIIPNLNKKSIQDIEYLASSLGFVTQGFNGFLSISGENLSEIPTLHVKFETPPFDPFIVGFYLGITSFPSRISDKDAQRLKIGFTAIGIVFDFFGSDIFRLQNAHKLFDHLLDNSIPKVYKNCTYKNKLALLEGFLVHSTGGVIKGLEATLNYEVFELAVNLGFKAVITKENNCNILTIADRKEYTSYPFTVKKLPRNKYCGFTLDGNGRFLLKDFLVTHNTIMGALLAYVLEYTTLVYCHRSTIRDAWLTTFKKCIPGLLGRIWVVGEKEPVVTGIPGVIICMDGRFEAIPEQLMRAVGTLIIDEAHLFCTPTRVGPLLRPQPRYIIAETATPERDDDMHLMIQSIVGTHGIFMISKVPYLVVQLETGIMVEESKNKIGTNYDLLCKSLCANEQRNAMAINIVQSNPAHKFMILTRLADHVRLLELLFQAAGITAATLYGNKGDYSDSRVLIGTMPKMGVGFDEENACKNFQGVKSNVLILISSVKKYQQYEQFRGRVMRAKSPIVVWFNDKNKIPRNHFKGLEAWIHKTNGTIFPFNYIKDQVILPLPPAPEDAEQKT